MLVEILVGYGVPSRHVLRLRRSMPVGWNGHGGGGATKLWRVAGTGGRALMCRRGTDRPVLRALRLRGGVLAPAP